MAWKITTLEVAASATSVHSTAGDTDSIIVQADHATPTIHGASVATVGTTLTGDLWDSAASVAKKIDAYPFIHCVADAGAIRTFIISERVKDPS